MLSASTVFCGYSLGISGVSLRGMKPRTFLLLGAGVAVGRMIVGRMVTAKPRKPLATVPHVDLPQYLGRWYEIAHYPARFERKCVANAMANYGLRDDGKIQVLNTCRKGDGEVKKVKGIAEIADSNTNAKLKVSFFGPFSGDYWILDLAQDYSYAAVGDPTRRSLSILSRTPQMDEQTYSSIAGRLRQLGFDPARLKRCPQVDGTLREHEAIDRSS